MAPSAMTPWPWSPSSRAGVVAHRMAASIRLNPTTPVSTRNTRSIVAVLPARVWSSRNDAWSVTVIVRPPSRARRARGQAGAGGPVGDGHDAIGAFRGDGHPQHAGMDVVAVAHQLSGNLDRLQDRPGKTRLAMPHRRHAIEEMRGLLRAGVDRGLALIETRRGMAQGHDAPDPGQIADQFETAVYLRRKGHDSHVGPGGLHDGQDVIGTEAFFIVGRHAVTANATVRWRAVRRRRAARNTEASQGLRAGVLGVDEVALEVRRQDSRAGNGGRQARVANLFQACAGARRAKTRSSSGRTR